MYLGIGFARWQARVMKKSDSIYLVGDLVSWAHCDVNVFGTIIKDLGVKTFTRKYLIYWHKAAIILENYESALAQAELGLLSTNTSYAPGMPSVTAAAPEY